MKDFGNTIYTSACVLAATILGIGFADYWFDGYQFSSFLSWAVLAAIPWLIGYAALYVLRRPDNLPIRYRGRVGKAHANSDRPTATS
jgi:hypothetical protein